MTALTGFAIDRRTLHDELVDRLREMIVRGELEPGAKIQEQALCDLFEVSRTPMREALRSLSAEGLVEQVPRRGATVAPMTIRDLDDAFPVIAALEGLAGELACDAATEAEIDELGDLQAELERRHAARDLDGYFAANEKIHRLIVRAARNPVLERMVGSLDGRVRRARCLANLSTERWAEAVAEHRDILRHLAARDAAALSRTLKAHIANKLGALRAQFSGAAPAGVRRPAPATARRRS